MRTALIAVVAGVIVTGPAVPTPAARHATGGTISGTVTYTGTPPRMRPIDMAKEPDCVTQHSTPVMTENVVTGPGNAVAWVVVYISAGDHPTPAASAVRYDQRGCQYLPHVAPIQVGQAIDIYNDDPNAHNIHPSGTVNPEWNRSQPPGAAPIHTSFAHEEFIPVRCNIHPWMHGYFAVLATSNYAVTGPEGTFSLRGLAPGHYTVTAWHERFGTQTHDVTITGGETATVGFVFRALPY